MKVEVDKSWYKEGLLRSTSRPNSSGLVEIWIFLSSQTLSDIKSFTRCSLLNRLTNSQSLIASINYTHLIVEAVLLLEEFIVVGTYHPSITVID